MVDLNIDERIKAVVAKSGAGYVIEIHDIKSKKIVSYLDSWVNPVSSAFVRARIRNEIIKFFPAYEADELDRGIMQAVITNRDALKALG